MMSCGSCTTCGAEATWHDSKIGWRCREHRPVESTPERQPNRRERRALISESRRSKRTPGGAPEYTNANLIAAAPELLEACRIALETGIYCHERSPGPSCLCTGCVASRACEAAIAKARGET